MKLFASKVTPIASEVVKKLVAEKDVETEHASDVTRDVEAVLNEYLRLEREVNAKTKELMEGRKLPQAEFGRVKKSVAEQKGLKVGEDVLDYLLDQIAECFIYSQNVEEVYSDDVELRRKMAPILKRHMSVEEDIDREIRARLKHVTEGTPAFEIEYAKALEVVRRTKGLS